MSCVSESQSNVVSSLASSKSHIKCAFKPVWRICQTVIQHSNYSILETTSADLFMARIYLIMLMNWLGLNNFFIWQDMLLVISWFLVGRKLKVRLYFCLTFMFVFANKLFSDLLDINFQAIYQSNKRVTTYNANVFGLCWIGNGATIKRMPLLNILVMCWSNPSSVIAILDCIGHMVDGGKKMLNPSCLFSNQSLMSFIQERYLLTPSSLMRHQMFRKPGKSYAHTSLRQCVSMQGNMFCHYSLVTYQELVQ